MRLITTCALMLALAMPGGAAAERLHGIAMHGRPALDAGFAHFLSVNPAAPRGGRLNLGVQGTFDSLNPFTIKGAVVQGVREYVFESLLARSPDEPFTLYGLIAETVEVPADRGSITFHLRQQARFSDGQPITADDVVASLALLKEKGLPYHRSYYRKVVEANVLDRHTVRFVFDTTGDRELPLIMGLMPVLPRHRYTLETFDRSTLDPPIGSGPYVVASVDPGRAITYRRNPDHWARSLNVMQGRFNFDEVRYEYFRDGNSLFEAFKAGDIDVRAEDDPGRWAQGYHIPAVDDGRIVMREFPSGLPAGMSAMVFNTRKPIFADVRVRRALILAFDFSWVNRNLYHSLYKRTESLFQRSHLASTGRSADATERALLAPFPDAVPGDIMEGRFRFPDSREGSNRDNLKHASALLRDAGYVIDARHAGRPGDPPAAAVRVPDDDARPGAPAARLQGNAGSAGHQDLDPAGRQLAILVAAEDIRLRHDPDHVARFAVARQRAGEPLEQRRRRRARLAQLCRRQERGRRRDDRRAAQSQHE